MKRTILLFLFMGVLHFTYAAYELVWSDEFDCDELNTTVWSYEIGNGVWGWGNNESEYYTDRLENIRLEDGKMIIHGKRENYGGCTFTSARIKSAGKVQVKYGKIEALIKCPDGGEGVWPAFWMLGTNKNGAWPFCGEIDIMEHMCTSNSATWNTTLSTIHYNEGGMNAPYANRNYGKSINIGEQLGLKYRIYGIEWTPTMIYGYYADADGSNKNVYFQASINPTNVNMDTFHAEFYILFNMAFGGTFVNNNIGNDVNERTMSVDWVRIYQDKTAYPESSFFNASTSCNVDIDECNNAFATYTSNRNSCNNSGNWIEDANLMTVSGTTITVNPKVSYTNMYAVAVGNGQAIDKNITYRLSGKINSTKSSTVRVYIESANDNSQQLFTTDNTISLNAGQEQNFSIIASSNSIFSNPALVLAVDNGPADAVYELSDVLLVGEDCLLPNSITENIVESKQVQIYLDPVESIVFLKSDKRMKQVDLFSMNGQLLQTKTDEDRLDVRNLHAGVYFVSIVFVDGKVEVHKLVK